MLVNHYASLTEEVKSDQVSLGLSPPQLPVLTCQQGQVSWCLQVKKILQGLDGEGLSVLRKQPYTGSKGSSECQPKVLSTVDISCLILRLALNQSWFGTRGAE